MAEPESIDRAAGASHHKADEPGSVKRDDQRIMAGRMLARAGGSRRWVLRLRQPELGQPLERDERQDDEIAGVPITGLRASARRR